MILPFFSDGGSVADVKNSFYGSAGVFDAKAAAVEEVLVTFGVQVGKTFAELNRLSVVDGDGAVHSSAFFFDGGGNVVVVNAHKPFNASVL